MVAVMDTTTIQTAIDAFLSSLNTESTRQTYSTPLRHFCAFLETQDSADALTAQHAIGFIDWLQGRKYAPETVKLYLTAVYQLYQYLNWRGLDLGTGGMARLKESYKRARNIRGESRPKDHKLADALAVVGAARGAAKSGTLGALRDLAIVETLRATGCRVGELAGLVLGDRDLDAHSAMVKGKGSKYRTVYWDERGWKALCAYLWKRQESAQDAPLFCGHGNRSNGVLSTRSISRIIQALAQRAGVPDVTPHYFRHVFATKALDATDNLAVVQDLLGHASPATTRVYARTDEKQRQAAHQAVWE